MEDNYGHIRMLGQMFGRLLRVVDSSVGGVRILVLRTGREGEAAAATQEANEERPPDPEAPSTAPPSLEETERERFSRPRDFNFEDVVLWAKKLFPHIFLVFIIFLYYNWAGMLLFPWLVYVQRHMNNLIRQQAFAKEGLQLGEVGQAAWFLTGHIALIAVATYYLPFWYILLWQSPSSQTLTFWQAVWLVMVADSALKLVSTYPKLLVVATYQVYLRGPKAWRQQGKLMTAVEWSIFTVRTLLPLRVWVHYFMTGTGNRILNYVLTGLYVICKMLLFINLVQYAIKSFVIWYTNGPRCGRYVGAEESMECGSTCPVCQDEYRAAVQLDCHHIFCEECISRWMERERTCPLCRQVIENSASVPSHIDGTAPLLPQIF